MCSQHLLCVVNGSTEHAVKTVKKGSEPEEYWQQNEYSCGNEMKFSFSCGTERKFQFEL